MAARHSVSGRRSRARVTLRGSFSNWTDVPLEPDAGYWQAFVPGVQAGDRYKFFVDGTGATRPSGCQ